MDIQAVLPKVKEEIEKAKNIVIVTGAHPSMDTLGSSLSLYLGLIAIGKTVSVVCATPMTVEFSNLVGANKLESKLNMKRNFVISLDYQEGSIEKVSYNIEGNTFNLVIEPRVGFEDFSEEKVHYTRAGGQADLIIAVATNKLEDLGSIYEENKDVFGSKPIVNLDYRKANTLFGAINVIDPDVSSMTELMAVIMSFSGVKLTEDIATNLLNSLIDATDQFQSDSVNARTHEVASVCMKAGAKRFPKRVQEEMLSQVPKSQGSVASPAAQSVVVEDQQKKTQNEDWLKPKIFKNPNANV